MSIASQYPLNGLLSGRQYDREKLISMEDYKSSSQAAAVRERRYAIRHPFAADADLLDLESGACTEGTTSDLSMGGCFVCTNKPFPGKTRVRAILTRKNETVEALAIVRIVKPRVGMGLEFIDCDSTDHETLSRWIEQARRSR
jgi:hypothetical protein